MSFTKTDQPPRPVVVISGAGGAGKTSLVKKLTEADSGLWFPRSWNTRKPRFDGEDEYRFVTEQRFQTMMDAGGFLEVAQVADYRVGAPQVAGRHLDKLLLLILTPDGWMQIRNQFPVHLSIWLTSHPHQLEQRMRRRGDSQQRRQTRMQLAELETRKAQQMGYKHTIENHHNKLHVAVMEAQAYIATFKHTL